MFGKSIEHPQNDESQVLSRRIDLQNKTWL